MSIGSLLLLLQITTPGHGEPGWIVDDVLLDAVNGR
jgi:hypothetical protein